MWYEVMGKLGVSGHGVLAEGFNPQAFELHDVTSLVSLTPRIHCQLVDCPDRKWPIRLSLGCGNQDIPGDKASHYICLSAELITKLAILTVTGSLYMHERVYLYI